MNYKINFEQGDLFVTIMASGDPTNVEFERYLNDLINNPSWQPGIAILNDFRELHIKNLTCNNVRENVRLHERYRERLSSSCIAVVVKNQVDFGLVRMWELLAESSFPLHRVFYSIDEAVIWLSK